MNFKKGINPQDLEEIQAHLFMLLGEFVYYAEMRDLSVIVTSIKDKANGRVSKTHEEGRAIDFSVRSWSKLEIDETVEYFNYYYEHLGAISARDGIPRVIVHHKVEGGAWHFHMQVRDKKYLSVEYLQSRTL